MNRQHEPIQLEIKIQVSVEAIQKLWTWTDLAKGEFSALGTVNEIMDQDTGTIITLLVTDLFLVKQTCSDADTELDPSAISQLMNDIEDPGKLKFWMHSHGDMGVFWSTTDDECIKGLANGEYLLSLVVNKKHQTLMRLDQFHPTHLFIADVAFEVHFPLDKDLQKQYTTEFKKKVKESVFLMPSSKGILTYEELDEAMTWMGYDEEEVPY